MKTVCYPLPKGLNIHFIAHWCSDNSVPMLFTYHKGTKKAWRRGRKACLINFLFGAHTRNGDTLIIRERDEAIMRLRF